MCAKILSCEMLEVRLISVFFCICLPCFMAFFPEVIRKQRPENLLQLWGSRCMREQQQLPKIAIHIFYNLRRYIKKKN